MQLISNKALREFAALHGDAAQPLQDFRRNVERGSFANFAELRAVFPSVDKAGARYVFNIGGNKYRLITKLNYRWKLLYIRFVLTHAEYDRGGYANDCAK